MGRWTGGGRTARTARDRTTRAAARAGLAARGVLYLLVGVMAARIALTGTQEQADRGGAVQELARQPFGRVLVWAVGLGLVGMALWRLSQVFLPPSGHRLAERAAAAARFLFYAVTAASVLAFAAGRRGSGAGSTDERSRDVTARALGWPAGRELVAAAGLALAGAGLWIAVRAVQRRYRRYLDTAAMPEALRRSVDVLGVGGGVGRGVMFAAAGVFTVRAAVAFDPGQAKGLDDTLRAFVALSAGPWLLTALAVALALFGLFSLVLARWRTL
ncbi:DUF1206 domain-containing protein [Streptomyces sp. NPDC049555]|uniref:DUF1206 domain-containing protein n=1 Tax=Streptomyces sp. NPDC049555 TaxID=3154930 RepID=UPI0034273144